MANAPTEQQWAPAQAQMNTVAADIHAARLRKRAFWTGFLIAAVVFGWVGWMFGQVYHG